MASARAPRRRHSTPIPSSNATSASTSVARAKNAMWTSPPSANGAAEMPAISHARLWRSRSTNAASGREETSEESSGRIDPPHDLLVDVDRERAGGVGHDPDVQHRRGADVDRTERARRRRRHQAELDAERREAHVLVLVPCGQRAARVRPELADVLHLEHRAEELGAVL